MHQVDKYELSNEIMRRIDEMPTAMVLAKMHYCAEERLALATVDEYVAVLGGKRRTIYNAAGGGALHKFEISGHLYLAING